MSVYKLPSSLTVDGAEYAIKSDFRAVLGIFEMLEDEELTDYEKSVCVIKMLYEVVPNDSNEALKQAYIFINGGQENVQSGRRKDYGRLFSWKQDILYIFSAVDNVLGFSSRSREYLQWWDWLSAFMAIGDCTFANIVHMRKLKKQGKLTKEEQKMWAEDPDTYELKDESFDEINDFLNSLNE